MMTSELLIRAASIVAAILVFAFPYRGAIIEFAKLAAELAAKNSADVLRLAASCGVIALGFGFIKLPSLPSPNVPVVPQIVVPEPSAEMQRLVGPISASLGSLDPFSRDVWAATWMKASVVASSEVASSVPVLTDTPALRQFTMICIDIAWRRIEGHRPGSISGLREAVESAMKASLGLDEVPLTPHILSKYVEVAQAIAWAGTR